MSQDEELIERTISVELREAANLLGISGDLDLRDACREAAHRLEALAQPVVGERATHCTATRGRYAATRHE